MIRIRKQLECSADAELFAEPFQKFQVRAIIASSLQEQHRDLHVEKMLSALVRRLSRRMKWESEKHQATHSGQRRCGLCLRSHPPAKGFATGEKSQLWNQTRCLQHRRA